MAPRRRKEINRELRPGMRNRGGYFSWTHPETGIEYGLGRDRTKAIKDVIAAEIHLATKRASLVERMNGAANTWGEWCDEFEKMLEARPSAANTKRTRKTLMKYLRAVADEACAASRVTTLDCSRAIDRLVEQGKHRMAQAFRSFLIDSFDRMRAKGWRQDNPAQVTDHVRVQVNKARLTLETFISLYQTTSIVWLRNAMALALVAGKDRDSVRNAQFSDFRDGGWWNERGKTRARVFLPLALRLHCFGMSLEDVLRQCRSTGIVSKYLVHQTERAKGATLGKPLHVDMITRKFSAELAKLNLDFGDKAPPTFHEIRSLAARLYKAQGDINPQDLLSHRDPRSTATYTDGRDEWVHLKVPS
jgi:hypothetical protein